MHTLRVWDRSNHGSWQLFGHSDGKLKGIGSSFDIGTECTEFVPLSLEETASKMARLTEHAINPGKQKALSYLTALFSICNLRYCYTLFQIHILDRVQQFHALRHWALEGFASGDETLSTRAFVDHGGCRSFSKVIIA